MSERDTHLDQLDLPRQNGELVFAAPWEARAFGLAVALSERGLYAWGEFSRELAEQIAAGEQQGDTEGYYQRWLESLEHLALEKGLVQQGELEARMAELAAEDHHQH